MELNFMLCNYDKCPNEENNQCPECMSGMMVLIGIIGGIVAAAVGVLLFVNEILTAPFTAALAALIISSVFLFTVIIASAVSKCGSKIKSCIKCNKGGLFFGIFGTSLSSLIAISVTLTAGSVLSAVIVGLVFFFFVFMLVSMLYLVCCTSECR